MIEAGLKGELVGSLKGELRIVSLYSKVVNLITKEGLLFSLVANEGLMSGLAVEAEGLFDEAVRKHLREGIPGRITEDSVTLFTPHSGIVISLKDASPWSGKVNTNMVITFKQADELGEKLVKLLGRHGKRGGFLDVIGNELDEKNYFLIKADRILKGILERAGEDKAGVKSAKIGLSKKHLLLRGLEKLVGLGIGFTPSGDDFIAGCLLGETLVNEREASIKIEREGIEKALVRTNDGGRSLLWQVLRGIFPAYIRDFLSQLENACLDHERGLFDNEMLEQAVRDAVLHGETSGTDTLTGFAWFLKVPGKFLLKY